MTCYGTDTQELDTGTMRRTTHSNCCYTPRLLPLVYHTRGWGGVWAGRFLVHCGLVYITRRWGGDGMGWAVLIIVV